MVTGPSLRPPRQRLAAPGWPRATASSKVHVSSHAGSPENPKWPDSRPHGASVPAVFLKVAAAQLQATLPPGTPCARGRIWDQIRPLLPGDLPGQDGFHLAFRGPGSSRSGWASRSQSGALSPPCPAGRPGERAAPQARSPEGSAGRTRSGTRSACPTSCG